MTDAVIIIGSISDRDVARKASGMFDKFGIKHTFQSGIAHNKAGDQGSCDCTSVGDGYPALDNASDQNSVSCVDAKGVSTDAGGIPVARVSRKRR